MMHESGRLVAAEHPGQPYLPPGGREEILTPDHQIDLLIEIVHRYGELVRPVFHSILEQEVPTLQRRVLVLLPQKAIDEPFAPGRDYHSDAPAGSAGQAPRAAPPRVPGFLSRRFGIAGNIPA
jgi:hypothetical protein